MVESNFMTSKCSVDFDARRLKNFPELKDIAEISGEVIKKLLENNQTEESLNFFV